MHFILRTKVLYENLADALELMEEILFTSHVTDKKRLKEILAEMVSQMKMSIADSGHTAMANRALSYFAKGAYLKELLEGVTFYEFANDLLKNFESKYDEICEKLQAALHAVAKPQNLMVSYTGMDDIHDTLDKALVSLKKYMNEDTTDIQDQEFDIVVKNEGFKTASKVQYVSQAGRFLKDGEEYNAALNVLQVIFSYDYLWNNVRVKNGAYGCMCGFSRIGDGYFTSYRDPNLKKTYEVYKNAPEYVKNFEASDRDMLKYIIGAIAKLDTPMTPSAEGAFSFACYLSGMSEKMLQQDRDEILSTDVTRIRELAPYIEAILSYDCIAALGDEDVIEKEADVFKELKNFN